MFLAEGSHTQTELVLEEAKSQKQRPKARSRDMVSEKGEPRAAKFAYVGAKGESMFSKALEDKVDMFLWR